METFSVDFKKAYIKANEILVSSNVITTFPFPIIKMISEKTNSKMVCRDFTKARAYKNLNISDFGSKSAILIEDQQGKKIIFFNEKEKKERTKFSIAHEFGHYKLEHNYSCSENYGNYEVETNFFAAQLLMPEQLIRELNRRGVNTNEDFLQKYFGVSKEAANKRLSTLSKTEYEWKKREEKEFDEAILYKYSQFLNSIKPSTLESIDWYDDEEELQNERNKWY